MTIPVLELRAVINRLLDDVVSRGVLEIDLQKDFYWTIDTKQLYDVEAKSEEIGLEIGRLSDDWGFVRTLLDPEREPVPYQLTEVAPLIRYLGEWASGLISPPKASSA